MKLAILISLIINMIAYVLVIIFWLEDCKEIGKDNLAVPLLERLRAAFFIVTLPCIFGLFLR